MQLTLNQTEIEQALENFVRDQISIKDGMKILIEIKATRGAEGMTALVDIVPAAQAAPVPTPVAVKPQATKLAQKPVVEVEKSREAEQQQQVITMADDPVVEGTVEAAEPIVGSTQDEDQVVTSDADAVPIDEQPVPVTKPKSLFAGLKSPRNS